MLVKDKHSSLLDPFVNYTKSEALWIRTLVPDGQKCNQYLVHFLTYLKCSCLWQPKTVISINMNKLIIAKLKQLEHSGTINWGITKRIVNVSFQYTIMHSGQCSKNCAKSKISFDQNCFHILARKYFFFYRRSLIREREGTSKVDLPLIRKCQAERPCELWTLISQPVWQTRSSFCSKQSGDASSRSSPSLR